MLRVNISVEIPTLMHELQSPHHVTQYLERRDLGLGEGESIHFDGENIAGHGFVEVVNFVYANFLGLDDVFPEFIIQVDYRVHTLVVPAILHHDWLRTLLVVSPVESLRLLVALKLKLLHIRLDPPDL